ncbi:MAG: hypothetical protein GF353_20735 [Candidatus Lokiarchaeota archaeon]|nr:hypothetical protein [Candidatus Lokiarchaeota archaeon]
MITKIIDYCKTYITKLIICIKEKVVYQRIRFLLKKLIKWDEKSSGHIFDLLKYGSYSKIALPYLHIGMKNESLFICCASIYVIARIDPLNQFLIQSLIDSLGDKRKHTSVYGPDIVVEGISVKKTAKDALCYIASTMEGNKLVINGLQNVMNNKRLTLFADESKEFSSIFGKSQYYTEAVIDESTKLLNEICRNEHN